MGNLQINLADKLAWPFACFIGVLLALPLALRFGKRGRTLGVAHSHHRVLRLLSHDLGRRSALGRNGAINPFLAAWLPNIIMGAAGAVLLLVGRALTTVPAGRGRRRGIAAIAALLPIVAGLRSQLGGRLRPSEQQAQLALLLFNTQSCAQH